MERLYCPECGKKVNTPVYIGKCPECKKIVMFCNNVFVVLEYKQNKGDRR